MSFTEINYQFKMMSMDLAKHLGSKLQQDSEVDCFLTEISSRLRILSVTLGSVLDQLEVNEEREQKASAKAKASGLYLNNLAKAPTVEDVV